LRFLLDEMYSDTISSELRNRGVDAISIHDRSQLEGSTDEEVMRVAIGERRVLVTNNVRDYAPLVDKFGLRGERHFGVVFTDDATFPRTRDGIGLFVRAIMALDAGSGDEAMLDGVSTWNRIVAEARFAVGRSVHRLEDSRSRARTSRFADERALEALRKGRSSVRLFLRNSTDTAR
jgi:hypothetical protein